MRRDVLMAMATATALAIPSAPPGAATMPPLEFPKASALPSQAGLPDPLIRLDGSRVASPGQWAEARRPELKALFEHFMYGVTPPPCAIRSTLIRADSHEFGGKATRKEVEIDLGETGRSIRLLLVVPNKRTGPVPAFLGTNFFGNHTALADPGIDLPTAWMPPSGPGVVDNKATDAGRGKEAGVWSVEKVVDRGYALATFYCGDVAPDHPGYADGIFPGYAGPDAVPRGPSEFGAVAAWAWGLSRALDFLATDGDIDATRVAVVGHSRLGKAALLAGAFDERFALTIGHQAGCGGSAPSRGKVGEQVKQINDRFPHWFAGAFKSFNDQVDRLPFDQNGLFALAAPRPLLLTNGTLDTWANPAGQFDALKAADGVYRLLGVKGIEDQAMPEPGRIVGDRLAYHLRPGKHAMTPDDWDTFLAFADRHLKTK